MAASQAELDECVKPGLVFDTVIFITFNHPDHLYFMCTVGNHCDLGMKFAIEVLPRPGTTPNAAVQHAALPILLLIFPTILANLLFFL